ncbi:DUF695 domain-containing protein [Sphingobacterium suaedae]|uniref:DUF695 domain-containing protein n=1 Tax=Sphingobacterium suaedae TaxID=1686402 RepID=A0ABW5KDE9_9SPHI
MRRFFRNLFNRKERESFLLDIEDPIGAFWSWFEQNEHAFFLAVQTQREVEQRFINVITSQLQNINPHIFTLVGMIGPYTAELVLTPDGHIPTVPLVEELVEKAPKLNNWKFTALKPAFDFGTEGLSIHGYHFSIENLFFTTHEDPYYPDLISISVIHPGLTSQNREEIVSGIFLFLDSYLGEYDLITKVDQIEIVEPEAVKGERIPISKLKNYLLWREKEFVERYESSKRQTENDQYSALEGVLQNGKLLLAVMNMDLLQWDQKPSHSWIMRVEVYYEGDSQNGLPNKRDFQEMNILEEEILGRLTDKNGYLYIGRQTGDGLREIYFACKEFRTPAKVLMLIKQAYKGRLNMDIFIFKDKYWQALQHLVPN